MRRNRLALAAVRALLLLLLWLLLTQARRADLPAGLLLAPALAAASLWLSPQPLLRFRMRHLPVSVLAFFWFSIKAGVDAAWRALHPRLPIRPRLLAIDLRLRQEAACIACADVISLMPGSLGAGLEGRRLHVHLLDDSPPVRRALALEEAAVERLLDRPPAAA